MTVASMHAMSATENPIPDPHDPDRSVWDGPNTERLPLCSMDTNTGTVVYEPHNPHGWVEIHAYMPNRQEHI